MNRIYKIAAAVLLIFSLTVPVMAVPSPDKDVTGVEVNVIMKDGSTMELTNSAEINAYLNVRSASVKASAMKGYSALTSFDVTLPEEAESAEVTFHVPGVKKGDTVMVKMYVNGEWIEVEATVVDDNMVKVLIKNSGTIAIYVKDKEGASAGNGSGTSPKTGEGAAFPAACTMAVLFGVIACIAGYKARRISE